MSWLDCYCKRDPTSWLCQALENNGSECTEVANPRTPSARQAIAPDLLALLQRVEESAGQDTEVLRQVAAGLRKRRLPDAAQRLEQIVAERDAGRQ
jgi:hypothetical protein